MAKSKKSATSSNNDYVQYAIEGIESVVKMLEKPRPDYIAHEDERISIKIASNKILKYREFANRLSQIADVFQPLPVEGERHLVYLTSLGFNYDSNESNRAETLEAVRLVLADVKAMVI